jgi:hypothetical protein
MRALALAVLLLGCASKPAERHDPQLAAREWSAAISHDDPHVAYELLTSSLKSRMPENDFAVQWKAAPSERAEAQSAMRAATVSRQAAVAQPDGRTLVVVREGAGWRLATPHSVDDGSDSPAEALRRLVAAADARDYDAILRLLAEPLRASLEDALNDRLNKLRAAIKKGGIDADGDHARIRFDSRYHIDLVRANGRWRIRDFN